MKMHLPFYPLTGTGFRPCECFQESMTRPEYPLTQTPSLTLIQRLRMREGNAIQWLSFKHHPTECWIQRSLLIFYIQLIIAPALSLSSPWTHPSRRTSSAAAEEWDCIKARPLKSTLSSRLSLGISVWRFNLPPWLLCGPPPPRLYPTKTFDMRKNQSLDWVTNVRIWLTMLTCRSRESTTSSLMYLRKPTSHLSEGKTEFFILHKVILQWYWIEWSSTLAVWKGQELGWWFWRGPPQHGSDLLTKSPKHILNQVQRAPPTSFDVVECSLLLQQALFCIKLLT